MSHSDRSDNNDNTRAPQGPANQNRTRTPRLTEITSAKNDLYKQWLSLLTSKGIKDNNEFLVSGEKICTEFLKSYAGPNHSGGFELLGELIPYDFTNDSFTGENHLVTDGSLKKYRIDKNLFKEIDVINTRSTILWVKFQNFAPWIPEEKFNGKRLVLPIGDPNNLGALLRSAEAFNAQEVVLCSESAHPYLPKSIKASSGSSLRVRFFKGPTLKDVLNQKLGADLFVLDQGGQDLKQVQWPSSFYLLSGEERGFGDAQLPSTAKKVSIKTNKVESLNVTVALSLALYEMAR